MLTRRILSFLIMALLSVTIARADAGPFNRAKMEALVAQVRKQSFQDEKDFFWIDSAGAPTLVSGAPPSGKQFWQIFARRDSNGNLQVTIITDDEGHAGHFGFAFSDLPFHHTEDGYDAGDRDRPNRFHLDNPGPANASIPSMRIDSHWVEIWDDTNS